MRNQRIDLKLVCKLAVAATALVALVALPARELAPGISLGVLLWYCTAGIAGVLVLLVVGAVVSLQFSQWVLRVGGTDTQWFWFSSEPRGLAALRKQQASFKAGRDES